MVVSAIHTLNAKWDIGLQMLRDHFVDSAEHFHRTLWDSLDLLVGQLDAAGVSYDDLRNVLTPQRDRHETAYVFQAGDVGGAYGYDIADVWLTVIESDFRVGVQAGDLLVLSPERIQETVEPALRFAKPKDAVNWGDLYAVYFNNMSGKLVSDLDYAFRALPGYLGSIDTTFASRAKDYISMTVAQQALLVHGVAIVNHGGDDPIVSDMNEVGYSFEEHGFRVVSVQDVFAGPFLEYKIESTLTFDGDVDREISLNALTPQPIDLSHYAVHIGDDKLGYLRSEKLKSLLTIGLADVDAQTLGAAVKDRIGHNYVYGLRINAFDDSKQFAVLLEFQNTSSGREKRRAAFRLIEETETLELLTFF